MARALVVNLQSPSACHRRWGIKPFVIVSLYVDYYELYLLEHLYRS